MARRTVLLLRGGALLCLAVVLRTTFAAELRLRNDEFAETAQGREQLKYLVGCALHEGVTVVAGAGSERVAFAGSMGLAPDWATRPMTATEQRRVSACMLARTNFFGVPVRISIRNDAPDAPESLRADEPERRGYPFLEAGFFGNLFQQQPEGYACVGDNGPARVPHLRSMLRVCSLPAPDGPAGISRCGFVIVGACGDRPFMQNGVDYRDDVLKVYLPAPR